MTLRRLLIIVCALGSCAAGCGSSAATPSTRTYASGLTHAAAFAFDAQSRLWVATAAYKDDGTDGVYLVPAAGAAPVEVIRGLHTPLGLLWLRGELYVASKERVDAYSGLVHNRFTKHRTVLTLPRGVGESNNLVLAPDGRLLLGISAPCDHCVPKSKYSAAIVSFTTTGRDLRVYARDIRAPVGLAFLNGKLYVTMNQRDDLGAATPGDTLAVVTEGSDWRFPAYTGTPPTVATLDKHAAVAGIALLDGKTALVAEWALGKVQKVDLTTGAVTTYLTSVKNPVAVAVAPDGSVLVGDWSTGVVVSIIR